MAQIGRDTYIFGSFKRSKTSSMRVSVDPPYEKTTEKDKLENGVLPNLLPGPLSDEFICKLCKKQIVDPRVLSCLHSFCLACLCELSERLNQQQSTISGSESNGSGLFKSEGGSGSSNESSISGYESEVGTNWTGRSIVNCPQCGAETKLPKGGLAGLTPHYVLQHRMLIASLNEESICLLCDLCSTEITAVTRCSDCLLNLCFFCSEAHKRQNASKCHELVSLKDGRREEPAITAVRRQIMCPSHSDKELSLYCSSCEIVICRDCCLLLHRGHPCEVTSRAAELYTSQLRERLENAEQIQRETTLAVTKLTVISQRVERKCAIVEGEIDKFVESYKQALDEHARHLREQVAEARNAKLQVITNQLKELDKHAEKTGMIVKFGNDLVTEGSETEVLSFAAQLVRKLEECVKNVEANRLPELKVLETLHFLPNEKAGTPLGRQMFGVVTTQRISAALSSLASDGLNVLNNCRQQQKCEVILITRDCDGQPMCHGGETVITDLRYRDVSHRSVPVHVADRQDGTYCISFSPDTAGNMILTVTIKGSPVKGSPFPVCVRTLRPHHGTFHCCSFCSSGGRKESSCGCGGQMPGGYRGCGHGHFGHPGRRHWSCCGNILHNSECSRPPPPLLHFSL